MKCSSCGAENRDARYCEYCGCELPKAQTNTNITITNNYYKNTNNVNTESNAGMCPRCNSTKIKFQREKIGSVGQSQSRKSSFSNTRESNSVRQNAYRTIGLCQNCGYTWNPNSSSDNTTQNKGWIWWLLVFAVWPILLSIWFYKTDKLQLEKKWRIVIIAVFWIVMLIIAQSSPDTETSTNSSESAAESTVSSNYVVDAEHDNLKINSTNNLLGDITFYYDSDLFVDSIIY